MAAPDLSVIPSPDRRLHFERWRRRSRLIHTLRIVLPLPASNKQRWTRAVIAFVPLALLGFALTMLIRDRL